jgi:hypothetical protein
LKLHLDPLGNSTKYSPGSGGVGIGRLTESALRRLEVALSSLGIILEYHPEPYSED